MASGRFTRVGISPPVIVGREADCYEFVIGDLEKRGVRFAHTRHAEEGGGTMETTERGST